MQGFTFDLCLFRHCPVLSYQADITQRRPNMASIALEHIHKRFKTKAGYVDALVDLDLQICEKELLVLVGPSGCGKTTALRIIAGLEIPDEGRVLIDNHNVSRVSPKDRDVAMVFQNYALYPHMSVYKNLAFGLKMRRTPKDEIKRPVQEVATMLHIQHLLDRKPASLSGGEKQRVAVGRAIARRPKVFLLDEPLANLDARLRLDMRTEIKRLQRELQISMIYVTHDQEEAMTLGHRIAIMHRGRLMQCGSPQQVYDTPANRFVASFMGTPPMNFLTGRLTYDKGDYFFSSEMGKLKLLHHQAYEDHLNQDVSLGIRPQQVYIACKKINDTTAPTDRTPVATLGQFEVVAVEPLGYATTVHLRSTNHTAMVASAQSYAGVETGDAVVVRLDLSQIHLFITREDGRRIA